MIRAALVLLLSISLPLGAAVIDEFLLDEPFSGVLPQYSTGERYTDLFTHSDPFIETVLRANGQPYSVEWIDSFVSEHNRDALLSVKEDELKLFASAPLVGLVVFDGEKQVRINVDMLDDSHRTIRLMMIWEKDEAESYRIDTLAIAGSP